MFVEYLHVSNEQPLTMKKKMNERLLPEAMENKLTSAQMMPLFAVNCNRIIDTACALAAIPNELSFDP